MKPNHSTDSFSPIAPDDWKEKKAQNAFKQRGVTRITNWFSTSNLKLPTSFFIFNTYNLTRFLTITP